MLCISALFPHLHVAPHGGAWIEIYLLVLPAIINHVAPHGGAWIEILKILGVVAEALSRSPRGSVD